MLQMVGPQFIHTNDSVMIVTYDDHGDDNYDVDDDLSERYER